MSKILDPKWRFAMCIRAVTLATLVSALAAGEEVKGRGTSIDDGPKFNVQLLNGALRRPPAGRSIVMTKKNGKRYRCHLPSTSTSGAAEETSGTPPSTPPLTSYLQQLKNTCFYRLEGWWTYEFCYRQSFRQYHQENGKDKAENKITQDYTLGEWWVAKKGDEDGEDSEDAAAGRSITGGSSGGSGGAAGTATVAVEKLGEDPKTRKRFWSQLYGNGTHCDITGRPRETEVRVRCSGGEPSHIASVEEVSTCRYVVYFATPLLCKHPAFAAEENSKDDSHAIQCEPLGLDGVPLPAPKKSEGGLRVVSESVLTSSAGAVAATAAPAPAPAPDPKLRRYGLGTCLLHMRYNYRGIVIGYDTRCMQSEAWMRANAIDTLKHGRNQPFYHVLADSRDRPGAPVNYVAQELLDLDTPPEPLQHPLLEQYFASFDQPRGRFVPSSALREVYGEPLEVFDGSETATDALDEAGPDPSPGTDKDVGVPLDEDGKPLLINDPP
jgi:hemimethylated DNA binding protein